MFASKHFNEGGVTGESSRSLVFTSVEPLMALDFPRLTLGFKHCSFSIPVAFPNSQWHLCPLSTRLPSARQTNFPF
jgi:hypothetical protein